MYAANKLCIKAGESPLILSPSYLISSSLHHELIRAW